MENRLMKLRSLVVAVAAFAMAGSALAQDTTSEKGKLSYYFGYDYGNNLAELTGRGEQLDINTVIKGLQDAYGKKQPALTADQLRPALEAFQKREQARAQKAKADYDKVAAENKTKSDQFLAQNKAKAGVQTLPSGVQYRVIEAGKGAKPTQASTVELEVAGPFPFGQRPTEARPAQQMKDLKVSAVEMAAMRETLLQMPAGSKWEIALPPDKAYGADPRTGFPPNLAVVFEIKLISVK
jgi:peptidylprolyl isomerase